MLKDPRCWNGGTTLLDRIEIDLRGVDTLTLCIDVADNSLSRKWLTALNNIIRNDLHLEKNYCWLGWTESERTAEYIIDQINASIQPLTQPIWVIQSMITSQ